MTSVRAELLEQLAQRAETEGLLDVAYAEVDSPLGKLLVATTPKGVVRLGFHNEDHDAVLDELADRLSPRVLEAPAKLDAVRRELDEYFEGRLRHFTAKLDWTLTGQGFRHEILRQTAKIPYGRTSTYMEMATKAGNRKAYRAAGNALGSNPIPVIVPCHRVLATGGGLGGYGGGLDVKERLLHLEGALG
ncbi:MAG TPA: methylated-DNA--[protein]-cysteine S-methyltransferase [Acidimicrobiales bacterium]|jgi:methylated-DNA-[protein]-cysteine S-methyltransferase|nr:methylated-DNA--[protein]-cysteine S-methyltransferase [Acidimicrobiales bacterium]